MMFLAYPSEAKTCFFQHLLTARSTAQIFTAPHSKGIPGLSDGMKLGESRRRESAPFDVEIPSKKPGSVFTLW